MKPAHRSILPIMVVLMVISGCSPVSSNRVSPVNADPELTPQAASTGVFKDLALLRNLPFDEFLDQSYIQLRLEKSVFDYDTYFLEVDPETQKFHFDDLPDISDAHVRQVQQLESTVLELLHTYDRSQLTPDQQVDYDVYDWYLQQVVEGHQYMYYDYPVNSIPGYGQDHFLISLLLNYSITDRESAEDYLGCLSEFGIWMDQLLEGMRLRQEAGIIPSRYMIERSLFQIERGYSEDVSITLADVDRNVLLTYFTNELNTIETIPPEEKEALLAAARNQVEQTIIPALQELKEYLTVLKGIAPVSTGAYIVPNGQQYYAYLLRLSTTTDMSPEEVHELGLAEVERIQEEMKRYAHTNLEDVPRNISMAELVILINKSPMVPFYEIKDYYQGLLEKVQQMRGSYFNLFPEREITIVVKENENSPKITSPLEDPGPLSLYLPLSDYLAMPVHFYHDYYPGHMFSKELTYEVGAPLAIIEDEKRFPGYVEGWATYMEQLSYEAGLYDGNPLANLARLQATLDHAVAAVVETGIQAKGWTLEEAASYMSMAVGYPCPPRSVLRHVVYTGYWPSYMVGYFKILEMRQRAKDRLGHRFDLGEFHDVILGHGQMPLILLDGLVNDWIEAKLNE